jgi:hypothetical protein
VAELNAEIAPTIQLAVLEALTICTNWPATKLLPVCESERVTEPELIVILVALVAFVPGAFKAVAALAAA